MAFTDAGHDRFLSTDGYASQGFFLSAHTGDPGTGDANEVSGGTYARLAITTGAVEARLAGGRQVSVASPGVWNIPAATTVTHVVLRTTSTGTGVPLDIRDTADFPFTDAGDLDLTAYSIFVNN